MDTNVILDNAIILIESDEAECMFDALGKAAGPAWNGGFGVEGVNRVSWDDPLSPGRKNDSHAAYAAVRQVLSKFKAGQSVICFSMSASKGQKVAMLTLAKGLNDV